MADNNVTTASVTNKPSSPQAAFSRKLFIIIAITLGFVLFGMSGYILGSKNNPTMPQISTELAGTPSTTKQENTVQEMKSALLKSNTLTTVILGAAINFVPVADIKFSPGTPQYTFQFYGLELSEANHKKFVNKAYPYGTFPSSIQLINDSPVWLASAVSDAEMILTKEGFICATPFNYGPITCADNESGACIYPQHKGLRCAYVNKSENNTLETVTPFIQKALTDAGINCANEGCAVQKLSEETIIISQYAKRVVYFSEIPNTIEQQLIDTANQEALDSANSFVAAGWTKTITDITAKERGSNPGVFSSIEMKATNSLFNCTHTITISNKWGAEEAGVMKKREIIECSILPTRIGKLDA